MQFIFIKKRHGHGMGRCFSFHIIGFCSWKPHNNGIFAVVSRADENYCQSNFVFFITNVYRELYSIS